MITKVNIALILVVNLNLLHHCVCVSVSVCVCVDQGLLPSIPHVHCGYSSCIMVEKRCEYQINNFNTRLKSQPHGGGVKEANT